MLELPFPSFQILLNIPFQILPGLHQVCCQNVVCLENIKMVFNFGAVYVLPLSSRRALSLENLDCIALRRRKAKFDRWREK